MLQIRRSQWPRRLRRRSAAACLLRSWARIPPGAWTFVCCECCVLSGRGLCDELITRPEESYRLCCVVVCDVETSRIGAPYTEWGKITSLNFKVNNKKTIWVTKILFLDTETTTWEVLNHTAPVAHVFLINTAWNMEMRFITKKNNSVVRQPFDQVLTCLYSINPVLLC